MSEIGNKALVILVKYAKPMAIELLSEVVEDAVMAAVAKSENKIDDVLAAALVPTLKQALIEQIEKLELKL